MATAKLDTSIRLNHAQCVQSIMAFGGNKSLFIVGPIGSGKSSLLASIAAHNGDKWRKWGDHFAEDKYVYCPFECADMDYSGLGMLIPDHKTRSMDFYAAAKFYMDDSRPHVIMFDERGKMAKGLQAILNTVDLERTVGGKPLPQGSIVFSTTNLASDGVGDFLPAHAYNRINLINYAAPSVEEWCEWATGVGLSAELRAAASMNRQWFGCYTQGDVNGEIFHPQTNNKTFVSRRSLAGCDPILRMKGKLSDRVIEANLAGTIGQAAASKMMTILSVRSLIESPENIIAAPATCKVPEDIGALYLSMFNALDAIVTQDDMTAVVSWMQRARSVEMESVLFTVIMRNKKLAPMGAKNEAVRRWAQANRDMLEV
jgi:hypothetical protein